MAALTVKQLDLIDDIRAIRHALHIGLDSFGEIERVRDLHEFMERTDAPASEVLKPRHPTGCGDTIGTFVNALALLDALEPTRSKATAPDPA